jgi:hypothetical protein
MTKAVLGGLGGHARKSALAVLGAMLLGSLLLAAPAWAGDVRSNPDTITIPDGLPATTYPSTITASGMPDRPTTDLDVTLRLSHSSPDDLDILLVKENGPKILLMSDAGGPNGISNNFITFDDEPASMPNNGSLLLNFRYRPTNYQDFEASDYRYIPDNMPSPAPAEPYATSLSAFDGENPNGKYELYVTDDFGNGMGGQIGSWSMNITAGASNDYFSEAQPINSASATIDGENIAASYEPDEPFSAPNESRASVWYRWTAPGTGPVTVDTCTTDYDGVMGVYTGNAVNSLTRVALMNNGCPSGLGAKVTFDAQVGNTYNIQVGGCCGEAGGFVDTQGTFTLDLSGPANTDPTITPRSPLGPTRDATPRIRATVTDTAGNPAAEDVRLFVDGRPKMTLEYDQATGALSYTSGKLRHGTHTVRVEATDGHQGTATESWSFKVRR